MRLLSFPSILCFCKDTFFFLHGGGFLLVKGGNAACHVGYHRQGHGDLAATMWPFCLGAASIVMAYCQHHASTFCAVPCCHGAAMVLPWCCHGAAMVLPRCCHGAGTVLARCWHGAGTVLAWCNTTRRAAAATPMPAHVTPSTHSRRWRDGCTLRVR